MKKKSEIKFEFQIPPCTSRAQSERLLSLGLKKETADFCWFWWDLWQCSNLADNADLSDGDIPAWSLGRLIEMRLQDHYSCGFHIDDGEDVYEKVISHIEFLIRNGHFNKNYYEPHTAQK